MSIELSSAPKGVKAQASADPHGKKASKVADAAGGGFATLMNLLSATDDVAPGLTATTPLADTLLAEKDALNTDGTMVANGVALVIQPLMAPAQAPAAVLQGSTLSSAQVPTLPSVETAPSLLAAQVPTISEAPVPTPAAALTLATLQPSQIATGLATAQMPALTNESEPAQAAAPVLPVLAVPATLPPQLPTLTQAAASAQAGVIGDLAPQLSSSSQQALPVELPETDLVSEQLVDTAVGLPAGSEMTANANSLLPQFVRVPQSQFIVESASLPVSGIDIPPSLPAESSTLLNKIGQRSAMADTGAPDKLVLANTATDASNLNPTVGQTAAEVANSSPVSALLAHRSAFQAQAGNAAQQDMKDVRAAAMSPSVAPAADAATPLLPGGASDLMRASSRFGAKQGFGQSGSFGFEGSFGQAMATTHRSEAVFEVPPASAVVPDTAIAETVSYWASQGVQTAELELEGFGDSPVEVSILLNGDQAQIDFRTDQEGVRQVLEAATAQLKELLSSQGLALAGVSVGTSGKRNDQGSEDRSRPGSQQATLVKTDALSPAKTRAANPAVGRSLDLFV